MDHGYEAFYCTLSSSHSSYSRVSDEDALHFSQPHKEEANEIDTPSPFVLGVHVGSVLQQELDDGQPVVAGREVQRRGLSTLHVPAVHVLHRTEFLRRGAEERTN